MCQITVLAFTQQTRPRVELEECGSSDSTAHVWHQLQQSGNFSLCVFCRLAPVEVAFTSGIGRGGIKYTPRYSPFRFHVLEFLFLYFLRVINLSF